LVFKYGLSEKWKAILRMESRVVVICLIYFQIVRDFFGRIVKKKTPEIKDMDNKQGLLNVFCQRYKLVIVSADVKKNSFASNMFKTVRYFCC